MGSTVKWQLKSVFKTASVVMAVSSIMLLFQNCGGPLHDIGSDDFLSVSASGDESNFLKGKQLYTQHCASCHNDFKQSTKHFRTLDQIKSAIQNTSQMNFLSSVSADDLMLIEYALANPNGVQGSTQIYQCESPSGRGDSQKNMRRLTYAELSNTLKSLLGSSIFNDSEIQNKLNSLPKDKMKTSPKDFAQSPSVYTAGSLFSIAVRAAEMLSANSSLRASFLASCAGASLTDSCIKNVIANFGLKVKRRQLSASESNELFNFYNSMGGGSDGLQLLVIRLLQSPSLVFHIEDNSSSQSNGRYRLSDYEIASRISYQVADSMPDDQLFQAAANGELQDLNNVKAHVERLLQSSNSKQKVKDFFKYYTRAKEDLAFNSSVLNYSGVSGAGLGAAMEQELFDFIDHIVWDSEANFKELMTSYASFPKTDAMATILQAPKVSANKPVSQSPQHAGLLHRPALLANDADRTTPILRGAHIRLDYLCDDLGVVPAQAVADREAEVGDLSDLPNRDAASILTEGTQCMGCHSQINNLGFPFEKFSPLGAPRAVEPVFDSNGNLIKEHNINSTVGDPKIESSGPTSLDNSVQLVQALAESKKAQACFAKKVYEYYKIREVSVQEDSCLLSETSSSASVKSLQAVFVDSIANEDIFWREVPK